MGKTLGEQAKEFRLDKGWSPAKMAEEVGGRVSRQSIENLEASGNRLPKYIGDLAHLLGVTVDEMLAEAGMFKRPPPKLERWPFEHLPVSRVTSLTPPDRGYVEGRLEEVIKEVERRAAKPTEIGRHNPAIAKVTRTRRAPKAGRKSDGKTP
jgi:transcriptional regulator with XRE-family HTH domain